MVFVSLFVCSSVLCDKIIKMEICVCSFLMEDGETFAAISAALESKFFHPD